MKKTLLTLLATAGLVASGCSRDSAMENAQPALQFSKPHIVQLPSEATSALKRGFADFTGDGITDMIEINDEAFFGQEWKGNIFPGNKGPDGVLGFTSPYTVDLPIQAKWFSSQTKLDTGDINGDGFADVILTQYIEGFRRDTYHFSVGVNQDGKNFSFTGDVFYEEKSIGESIISFIARMNVDSHEDIYDYFKMDWADMNGDGKDDLVLLVKQSSGVMSYNDLYVETWLSESDNQLRFGGGGSTVVPGILYALMMNQVDTEDFTGDGLADIVFYRDHIGRGIDIAFAHNQSTDGQLNFTAHKDFKGEEPDFDSFTFFSKRDSFDANGDGRADYVHAGKIDGKPSIAYMFAQPLK